MDREQRVVFGEVAELYDRARASYPEELVDDVVAHCRGGSTRALEVGAGTGKATVDFARRGLDIVAIEPDRAMAEVAARRCRQYPRVSITVSSFEDYASEDGTFRLLLCAQAWHWIDPAVRCAKAARVLERDGTLALFWHRTHWADEALRDALDELYMRLAPDLREKKPGFPGLDPPAIDDQLEGELESSGLFGDVERRLYRWSKQFTAETFVELLLTQSDHRLYPEQRRGPLLEAVRDLIVRHGDAITVPHSTLLILARSSLP